MSGCPKPRFGEPEPTFGGPKWSFIDTEGRFRGPNGRFQRPQASLFQLVRCFHQVPCCFQWKEPQWVQEGSQDELGIEPGEVGEHPPLTAPAQVCAPSPALKSGMTDKAGWCGTRKPHPNRLPPTRAVKHHHHLNGTTRCVPPLVVTCSSPPSGFSVACAG